ncbi:MAG: NAD-dependent epimerase/dehydratase family protein [Bacteroidota bacterium]
MILVTGGTGFLGAHLLIELCSLKYNIRALKRPTSDLDFVRKLFDFYNKSIFFNTIEWVDCDILDVTAVKQSFVSIDIVYHCAAKVSFSEKDKTELFRTNIEGTSNLMNTALVNGVKKMCYVSSIAVLGKSEIITEKSLWDENEKHSKYARSKYCAELEVWRIAAEGLNSVIVCPSVIIGPWKWDSGIGSLFKQIGNGLNYYTGGSNSFVDVRDVVKSMIMLTESNIVNDNFIITSENLSYKEIVYLIAETIGKKSPKRYASLFITEIAWRLNSIIYFLLKNKSSFTKDTARISQNRSSYSNKKVSTALPISYIRIKQSLENCQNFYTYLSN